MIFPPHVVVAWPQFFNVILIHNCLEILNSRFPDETVKKSNSSC
jgi:hypothetical protein